jgi:hypothetical protein
VIACVATGAYSDADRKVRGRACDHTDCGEAARLSCGNWITSGPPSTRREQVLRQRIGYVAQVDNLVGLLHPLVRDHIGAASTFGLLTKVQIVTVAAFDC